MNAIVKMQPTEKESAPTTESETAFEEWYATKYWHPDYKEIAKAAYKQGIFQGEKQKEAEWMQRMVDAYARNGANAFGDR